MEQPSQLPTARDGEQALWRILASRPVLSVVVLLALAGIVETIPELTPLRLFGARRPTANATASATHGVEPTAEAAAEPQVGELELDQQTQDRPALAAAPAPRGPAAAGPLAQAPLEQEAAEATPPSGANSAAAEKPPVSLVDSERLAPFYASLGRSLRKEAGAITRVAYHGDSLVASDYVTATLRRRLQAKFGDAGHGFVLMANAWASYFHMDVYRETTKGFLISRVVGPYVADGFYGLGGVSFKAASRIRAQFGTARKGDFGRNVSRFELAYLAEPNAGALELSVDGRVHGEIQTAAPEPESRFAHIDVPDGEHTFEVYTKTGTTRTFGAVLERAVPGVVLDAIGIQGARIRFLDKQDDRHWATQLAWRRPNLLVFHFGANESGDGFAYSMADYNATMRVVLEQAKRAVPDAACLVVAAMDRARQVEDGMITVPVIPLIVEEQRKVAHEVGCAFWNTFEAMGGRGSMARWVRRELGQADLTHPTGAGAERLGNWLYAALLEGFERHQPR